MSENQKKQDHLFKLLKLRHSAEHVLHDAVQKLYPKILKAMGPATDDGFYFDFDPNGELISELDFPVIEAEMQKIIDSKLPIIKQDVAYEDAKKLFKGNPYKLEWIEEYHSKGEPLTVYWMGEANKKDSTVDLCKGPHAENTSEIKTFKLLSIAGAYWRGSEKNKMLSRIYGTAFVSKEELDEYLHLLEEAKKRDHRKLGRELEIFTFSDEVGPGLPLWLPKGTVIKEELEKWAKETEEKWGYKRVSSPHIAKHTLYEMSGHLPYYKDDMYSPMDIDGEDYYLKGMNCPHHHMIYKASPKSYKDLPLRYAEYGMVYRYEQSGTLFGLMRVRALQQNDAHIYCTLAQAEDEFLKVLQLHEYYYNTLGLTKDDYYIAFGLPDPAKKDKYHGDKKIWEKAESIMRTACKKSGIKTIDDIGGAAFYGPKTDFTVRSSIGREFAISTNQLDLFMPQRFNLEYTNEKGHKELCAVIHRAPLGSHERFVGFLIEHFAGAFPVWLSPVQVQIITVSKKAEEYAKSVTEKLNQGNIRTELDINNETIGNKIRKAVEQKVPYIAVVGEKEVKNSTVSVRLRDGEQMNDLSVSDFINLVSDKIKTKSLQLK